jgi:hypothetical protein
VPMMGSSGVAFTSNIATWVKSSISASAELRP